MFHCLKVVQYFYKTLYKYDNALYYPKEQNKMSVNSIEELNELRLEVKNVELIVQSFNFSFNQFVCDYFSHSLDLSTYIYKDIGDKEILEAKLLKHFIKFKEFCETFSKLKRVIKYSVSPSERTIDTVSESFKFLFNYSENATFVNTEELNAFFEHLETYNKKVTAVHQINYKLNEDFIQLKNGIKEMNKKLSEERIDIYNLKSLLGWIKHKLNILQMNHYNDILVTQNEIMQHKFEKYRKKYYYKFIMKKQETFKYDDTRNNTKECAVCLESIYSGKSVKKLKCGHLFCTKCIEKWLKDAVTCPCCRKNPRYLL